MDTGQLVGNMRVRIVVEYGEVLPVELRDEYKAVPQVETFEFSFKDERPITVRTWARHAVLRELLKRDTVCEFIKTLDLELC